MRKNTHTHTYTPNENDAKALKLTEYRSMFTMERAVDSWIVHFSSHDKWCECCWFCSPFFSIFFSWALLLFLFVLPFSLHLNDGAQIFRCWLEKVSILWLSTESISPNIENFLHSKNIVLFLPWKKKKKKKEILFGVWKQL